MVGKYSTQKTFKTLEQQVEDTATCEASRCTASTVAQKQSIIDALVLYANALAAGGDRDRLQGNAMLALLQNGATEKISHGIIDSLSSKFSALPTNNVKEPSIIPHVRARYSGRNS